MVVKFTLSIPCRAISMASRIITFTVRKVVTFTTGQILHLRFIDITVTVHWYYIYGPLISYLRLLLTFSVDTNAFFLT